MPISTLRISSNYQSRKHFKIHTANPASADLFFYEGRLPEEYSSSIFSKMWSISIGSRKRYISSSHLHSLALYDGFSKLFKYIYDVLFRSSIACLARLFCLLFNCFNALLY